MVIGPSEMAHLSHPWAWPFSQLLATWVCCLKKGSRVFIPHPFTPALGSDTPARKLSSKGQRVPPPTCQGVRRPLRLLSNQGKPAMLWERGRKGGTEASGPVGGTAACRSWEWESVFLRSLRLLRGSGLLSSTTYPMPHTLLPPSRGAPHPQPRTPLLADLKPLGQYAVTVAEKQGSRLKWVGVGSLLWGQTGL